MISYAQNFEDVMLARLFGEQQGGFYVDIGASHPSHLSVTRYFYDQGWHGINVEPIPRNHERLLAERPRDVSVRAAIGREPGERRFFEVPEFDALSTLDEAHARELGRLGYRLREYAVPVVTADALFAEHGLDARTVDFLKIDVEGYEAEVLASLDLRRFRPRALVIESTIPASGFPGWDRFDQVACHEAWEPRVLAAGYRFAHFDGISRFYLRDEDAGLAARFALPPGFFDQIVPASQAEALRERDQARVALDRARAEVADAAAQVGAARAARDEAGREAARERERARAAVAERDEALARARARLEAETAALAKAVAERDAAKAEARRLHDMSLAGRVVEAWRHVRRVLVRQAQGALFRAAQGPPAPPLPRITLVTPVYNGERTIAETLESTLSQAYPDLEVIVVDGASTDGTLAVVESFRARTDLPQRIARVVSEPDRGMYDALAKGFALATGEVLCYLNADDLLEHGALLAVGRHFAANPRTQVLYHEDTVLVDGWKFANRRQHEGVDVVDLLHGHILFQDGVFFRRGAYEAIGGVRRDLRLAGDYDLWLRLAGRFAFERAGGHRSCFRMREGQLSLDHARYHEEMQRARRDFVAGLPRLRRHALTLRGLWRRTLGRRPRNDRASRLFYPIDFGNLPPPKAIAPAGGPPRPASPVDGLPAERFVFSCMDTRFGGRELNWFYHDARHDIAVCWPPVAPARLDELYRTHYSSPPTTMVVPEGASPFRQCGGPSWWERAALALPLHRLGRFLEGLWTDNTLRELTLVLRGAGLDTASPLRVLDAGCFEGNLLDQLRASRPWRAAGLEPNARAVAVARGKGHEVWHARAEDAAEAVPEGRQFDVIFMGQSIEHVDDPVRVLRRLRLLLAPGGALVMSTPNLDSRQVDWFGPTWAHWHPPFHRFIFSRRGLESVVRQAGLVPRGFRSFSDPYWTTMSLAQNWLGLGGSVSHAVDFDRALALRAQRVEVLQRALWNRLGKGDYFFLVAGDAP